MEKKLLYVRLVRELAVTIFALLKVAQIVIELVSPALNYRRAFP